MAPNVCLQVLSPNTRTVAIQYLRNSGMIPVYVYFDLPKIATQTANKVAASFLKQLAYPPDQRSPLPQNDLGLEANRPSRQAIIDLFRQCSKFVNIRVLFDALDECNENERGKMYQFIEKLRKANIGVYLTTRPHIAGDLQTRFPDASYMENLEADEEDVRKVLEYRIEEHTPPIEHDLREWHIPSRILGSHGTYLLSAERGLSLRFLLASVQLEDVLRAKGPRNMRNALNMVPSTTDRAFEAILKRIEQQEEGTRNTAYRTLTWCYYASRPLWMVELCDFLAFEDELYERNTDRDDPYCVINCCMSFITGNAWDRFDSEVRFIHPSVQRWSERQPQHHKLLSHAYLAETCLSF